nr:PREDICTED: HLA class II histocompatibility antigen, DRB1-1 beta chain-like isoform X2 [Lepisosteus oculatus]
MRLVLLCSALVLCLTLSGADDFVYFFRSECHFSASDLRDLVYVRSMTFNGKERVRFNSTVGKYVGFDTWGEKQANYWNGQKDYIARLIKPEVKIYPAKTASQGHTHMLVCHAHGFYPRQIAVSWLRNGQPVSSDLTSMSFASDGDWTYQTLLYLEFTPQGGETFECAVDHVALDGTLKLRWDPAAREAKRNKVIMGASGLVLGLVFAVIGVVYWKRKTKGHIAVPTVQS